MSSENIDELLCPDIKQHLEQEQRRKRREGGNFCGSEILSINYEDTPDVNVT